MAVLYVYELPDGYRKLTDVCCWATWLYLSYLMAVHSWATWWLYYIWLMAIASYLMAAVELSKSCSWTTVPGNCCRATWWLQLSYLMDVYPELPDGCGQPVLAALCHVLCEQDPPGQSANIRLSVGSYLHHNDACKQITSCWIRTILRLLNFASCLSDYLHFYLNMDYTGTFMYYVWFESVTQLPRSLLLPD